MENRFHLAIPAGDLDKAIKFYCEVLGCERGNAEFKYPDAWADINFWGNELTLHATDPNHKIISEVRGKNLFFSIFLEQRKLLIFSNL